MTVRLVAENADEAADDLRKPQHLTDNDPGLPLRPGFQCHLGNASSRYGMRSRTLQMTQRPAQVVPPIQEIADGYLPMAHATAGSITGKKLQPQPASRPGPSSTTPRGGKFRSTLWSSCGMSKSTARANNWDYSSVMCISPCAAACSIPSDFSTSPPVASTLRLPSFATPTRTTSFISPSHSASRSSGDIGSARRGIISAKPAPTSTTSPAFSLTQKRHPNWVCAPKPRFLRILRNLIFELGSDRPLHQWDRLSSLLTDQSLAIYKDEYHR